MMSDKKETILWTFIIVVLLFLTFYISTKGDKLSCDQCTVTFKDKTVTEKMLTDKMELKVKDLYQEWAYEDHCLVYWNPVQGFGGNP